MLNRFLKHFRKYNLLETALHELDEAERERLRDQSHAEFYQSSVAYNDARIKRLKEYIASQQANVH